MSDPATLDLNASPTIEDLLTQPTIILSDTTSDADEDTTVPVLEDSSEYEWPWQNSTETLDWEQIYKDCHTQLDWHEDLISILGSINQSLKTIASYTEYLVLKSDLEQDKENGERGRSKRRRVRKCRRRLVFDD